MYKRILVATDGSELSAKAVDHAIGLAKVHGAELFALKVTQLRTEEHWDGAMVRDPSETAAQDKRWSEISKSVIDGVAAKAQVAGVKSTGIVEKSNFVADTVIDVARKNTCDLIVMASHGRRGLARVLLGSETQHVLTHSHIPVLVLR